ncbi:MAG: nucleoside phosphorylase [Paludibacteraceae bacterium]|nr:nucleoside phosphorylase [Paludibacteraceae bacterium]MBR0498259.1 nucleoside phosphorylase [Paludibacteraceae bacterium]MBR2624239.1 nucleoside phosphorylase [Paludibacteraceae bacterium]MBR6078239.1 nucleoside phosphorylase [Paludibacteraceae bacterium]
MKRVIEESELIIRDDGSVFHLNMKPSQLADRVILVGDPGRVELIASRFDSIESRTSNREFVSATGSYQGKRITVLSTGIGTDNIDIVMNELDALVNIDLATRTVNDTLRSLTIVRIGTCGGMQEDVPLGSFVASEYSIGIDGVLNFYAGRDAVSDLDMERAFVTATDWNPQKAAPYVVKADDELTDRIAADDMIRGITVSANGFYAPQGRVVRLQLDDPDVNSKIRAFRYGDLKVCNYEMEGSLIAGLSRMMGHKALTVCCVIANRFAKEANVNYKGGIECLIDKVLHRI